MDTFTGILVLNTSAYVRGLLISCLAYASAFDKFVICNGIETKICTGGMGVSMLAMTGKAKMKIREASVSIAETILYGQFEGRVLVIADLNDVEKYEFNLIKNKFPEVDFIFVDSVYLASYLKGLHGRQSSVQSTEDGDSTV